MLAAADTNLHALLASIGFTCHLPRRVFTPPAPLQLRRKLMQLKLSNKAVWDREHAREAAGEGVATPWFVKGTYLALCVFLDVFFENRPIQRFWFLETVARMP